LREFRRAAKILGAALVIDGQLFAGVHAVLRIANNFLPDFGGAGMLAASLGHQREIAACLRAEFGRQPRIQRLRARGMCPLGVAASLKKSR
jgi:hypothetical protein